MFEKMFWFFLALFLFALLMGWGTYYDRKKLSERDLFNGTVLIHD